MASLFKLVGSIFIDNEEANASLQKTDEKAKGTANTFASGVGKAAKFGAAVTGAAVGASTAVVGLAVKVAGTADEIDKASIRMGVDAEYYQKLSYAAGQCGVDMSVMEKAAKKLEGTDITFDEALDQIMSLGTEAERSAAAAELFGESVAYQMSPMLQAGGEAVNGLMDKAEEMGMVMSNEAVAGGVQLGDTIDTLTKALGGIIGRLASSLMPIIQQILDKILDLLPLVSSLADGLAPLIEELLNGLLPPLLDLVSMIVPILVNLLQTLLPPVIQIVSQLLPMLVELLGPILELLNPLLQLVMALLTPMLDAINKCLTPMIAKMQELINWAIVPLTEAIEWLTPIFSDVFGGIFEDVSEYVGNLIDIFSGIISFVKDIFKGDFKKAWVDIVDVFGKIWSNITIVFKRPLNLVIGLINGLINGIEKGVNFIIGGLNKVSFAVPDWVPEIGGKSFGFNIPKVSMANIPYLAEGGVIDTDKRGQLFVANERGPELVHSYDGKTAVTNNADVLTSIKEAVGEEMANAVKPIEDALDRIAGLIPREINIDGKAASKILAPAMDRELGNMRRALR